MEWVQDLEGQQAGVVERIAKRRAVVDRLTTIADSVLELSDDCRSLIFGRLNNCEINARVAGKLMRAATLYPNKDFEVISALLFDDTFSEARLDQFIKLSKSVPRVTNFAVQRLSNYLLSALIEEYQPVAKLSEMISPNGVSLSLSTVTVLLENQGLTKLGGALDWVLGSFDIRELPKLSAHVSALQVLCDLFNHHLDQRAPCAIFGLKERHIDPFIVVLSVAKARKSSQVLNSNFGYLVASALDQIICGRISMLDFGVLLAKHGAFTFSAVANPPNKGWLSDSAAFSELMNYATKFNFPALFANAAKVTTALGRRRYLKRLRVLGAAIVTIDKRVTRVSGDTLSTIQTGLETMPDSSRLFELKLRALASHHDLARKYREGIGA